MSERSDLSALMQQNDLSYMPPLNMSLVNSRQYKKYNFTPLNYAGVGAPEIVVNSGSDYVYGPSSAIMFTVISTGTDPGFGLGSAYNLFNEYEHTHRSGDQIDRVKNVNSLVESLTKYGQSQGYADNFRNLYAGPVKAGTEQKISTATDVVLPLSWFSGLWAQQALVPSHLVAGSKIKLQLESVVNAIQDAGSPAVTISNMVLLLDSFDLFDSAKKALMQQAGNVKTQGLQYSYHSWFNVSKTFTTSAFDFDVNLSAAKTMQLLVKTRATADFVQANDSMVPSGYEYLTWRVRIGSSTQPQHEVTSSAEGYLITMNSLGALSQDSLVDEKRAEVSVAYEDYKKGASAAEGVLFISLEKNQILNLSGEATNNSRLTNISGTFDGASSRQMDIWVKHLRIANVMMDNLVVDK